MKRLYFIFAILIAVQFALPATDAELFATQAQAQTVVVTGNGVRLRYGPSLDAGIYTQVNKGARLTYRYTYGDWFCVRYGNKDLYISRQFSYLTNNNYGGGYSHVKITGNGVRLRYGPGLNYGIYTQLNKGAVVTWAGTYGNWYAVYYNGYTLYVSRDFASLCR